MPNQLSMATNCPFEMVVRMRDVLITPDWFHLAFFLLFISNLWRIYILIQSILNLV